MPYKCGDWTFSTVNRETGRWYFGKVHCKTWGCPKCAARKAKAFRRGVAHFALQNKCRFLMTLTLNPRRIPKAYFRVMKSGSGKPKTFFDLEKAKKYAAKIGGRVTQGPVDTGEYIKKTWAKFRVYLARKISNKIKWVYVMEFQPGTGNAHLHILMDAVPSKRWISRNWSKLGGGYIVDVKPLTESWKIAAYLTKYLSKGFSNKLFKKGQRRLGAVQGAGIFQKGNMKSLFIFKQTLESIIANNVPVSVGAGLDGILNWADFDTWPQAPDPWGRGMVPQIPF